MLKFIRYTILALLLAAPVSLTASTSYAQTLEEIRDELQSRIGDLTPRQRQRLRRIIQRIRRRIQRRIERRRERQANRVPELDPRTSASVALMVLGAAVVVYDRRRRSV